MPSVSVNQLNRGNAIQFKNDIYIVSEMDHVKPGKGPAYVQMKLKHSRTGKVVDQRFRSQETVEQIAVDRADYLFSYAAGEKFVFMHNETYEEVEIPADVIGEMKNFLVEGNNVTLLRAQGEVLSIDLPKTVTLEVVETEPGIKNASATNVGKPATTNTGLVVTVPPFINEGDKVKVDTDTGEYMERVND